MANRKTKFCCDCGKRMPMELMYPRQSKNAAGDYSSAICYHCIDQDKFDFTSDMPSDRRSTRFYYLARYGLNERRYRLILVKQGFRCAICRSPDSHHKRQKLFVDHDHKTGKVRGLLCHRCNIRLGLYHDEPPLNSEYWKYLHAAQQNAKRPPRPGSRPRGRPKKRIT